ncbi:MAG: hypothetical protein D6683_15230 [Actinomyces sp.]|nr:MAG: hypothetical protein D6683_15230 [Actinomyces sp.]
MARRGRIPFETRLEYHRLRFGEQWTRRDAAAAVGVSESWATTEDRKVAAGVQVRLDDAPPGAEAAEVGPPLRWGELSKRARRGIEDFHFFCETYFGVRRTPWRTAAFDRLWKLWCSDEREYVVVNAPPGSGKSQLFMHDFCAWLTVRDRRIRGLHGSATHRLASRYTKRLRQSFVRTRPLTATRRDLDLGLATDAVATLPADYGRFRPAEQGWLWQMDQFEVELPGGADTGQKEPTWQAYGRDSDQLGNRVDLVVWDDLVTRKTLAQTISEEFVTWFTDEAETRVEPGGLFVLQGQRIDANDLYRNRLDVEVVDLDDEGNEVRHRMYHHVCFPAHFDEHCRGLHARTDPPARFDEEGRWVPGSGCLLDPVRLPWRELQRKRAADQRNFDVLYQQKDVASGSRLVEYAWIAGGTADGVEYVGCTDTERDRLQFPAALPANAVSVASVDPSSTGSWAIEWWVNEPEPDIDHLIDLYKGPLTAGELLSFNPANGEFYGMMHTWQLRSIEMRRPIIAWVVEVNTAQRYLLQHEFVRMWMMRFSVMVIPHYTHRHNKQDPEHGFWAMRNQFRWGKVRLPYKGDSEGFIISRRLIDEALRWPTPHQSDDALMAYWMYRLNLPKVKPETVDYRPVGQPAPSWLR